MRTVAKVVCRLKLWMLPSGSTFPREASEALGVVSALAGMLCTHRSRLLIHCTSVPVSPGHIESSTSPLGRRLTRRSQIRSRDIGTGNDD